MILLDKISSRNNRTDKALKHIVFSFILQGISIIIGLLYVPLLLEYLSKEKYGIWLTLSSILGWFSFFDIGMGNGLRNKLGEAFAVGDLRLAQKYVSTTYAILACIFSSILIVFHIINYFLNWNLILNSDSVSAYELYLITAVVFTFFIVRFVVQLISVIYLADQRSSINHLVTTVGNSLSFILVVCLTRTSAQEDMLLLVSLISGIPVVVFLLLSLLSFNGKYQYLKPSIKEIDFKLSKDLINLGFKFFFVQVSAVIIFSTASFFIAQYYGPDEVVVYNIVFRYFQLPVMIFSIILSPVWSAVTDAHTKGDIVWMRKTLKRLNLLSIAFVLLVVFMLVFSPFVFRFWLGDKLSISWNLCLVMAIYTALQLFGAPYSSFINGFGKIHLTMSLTACGIFTYLLFIYLFCNFFTDSIGVMMAIICTSLVGVIFQPIQIHKVLNGTAKGIWNR